MAAAAVDRPREQRDARAPHEAREEIAAELVGAEQMAGREQGPEPVHGVDGVGIGEGQMGSEACRQYHAHQTRKAKSAS
jgi:hypothetical protein